MKKIVSVKIYAFFCYCCNFMQDDAYDGDSHTVCRLFTSEFVRPLLCQLDKPGGVTVIVAVFDADVQQEFGLCRSVAHIFGDKCRRGSEFGVAHAECE